MLFLIHSHQRLLLQSQTPKTSFFISLMDIKEICRDVLQKELFVHKNQTESWRILVFHEHTAHILTNLYTKSELLSKEVLMLSRLEEDREKNDNPAIYFLKPDDKIIKQLEKDHKNKTYTRFTVVFTNELTKKQETRLKKLENPSVVIRNSNIDFVCFDKFVFLCEIENILSFSKIIGNYFNVFYVNERDNDLALDLEGKFNACGERKGDLILFDRYYDLTTPLLRFFSFQALLNDFGLVKKDFYEPKGINLSKFNLWHKIRFKHIREVNTVITSEAQNLAKEMNKPDDMSMNDFMKMVLSAPKAIQTKQEITTFLDLLNQCITKFEVEDLNFVSMTEQSISLKKDAHNSNYIEAIEDFSKICNSGKVGLDDIKRIYLLLGVNGYNLRKENEMDLKNAGAIQSKDIKVNEKLGKISNLNIRVKQKDFKYTVSRYKPVIETVIRDFVDNKKPEITFYDFVSVEKPEAFSLRKTSFIYTKVHKKRRCVCLYIKNGITYEEIRSVYDLGKKYNIDIFLGSNKILSHESFCEDINQMVK